MRLAAPEPGRWRADADAEGPAPAPRGGRADAGGRAARREFQILEGSIIVLTGGLKVLKRLGQGSSAVALLVEHEDEELVLKLSLRPDRNERLRHEGQVFEKLRHQSIVRRLRQLKHLLSKPSWK